MKTIIQILTLLLIISFTACRTKNKTTLKLQEQSKESFFKNSLLSSKQKDSLVKEFNSKNAEKKEKTKTITKKIVMIGRMLIGYRKKKKKGLRKSNKSPNIIIE